MNFPLWLATRQRALPGTLCQCGRVVLTADARNPHDLSCTCAVPRLLVDPYLPEHGGPDDGPSVAWAPAPSKDVEFRADGQGGVVIYRRSRATRRMMPGRRIPAYTEVP